WLSELRTRRPVPALPAPRLPLPCPPHPLPGLIRLPFDVLSYGIDLRRTARHVRRWILVRACIRLVHRGKERRAIEPDGNQVRLIRRHPRARHQTAIRYALMRPEAPDGLHHPDEVRGKLQRLRGG